MASIKTRDSATKAIKQYMEASGKVTDQTDTEQIKTYLKLLEEQWVRFNKVQELVEETCGEATLEGEEANRDRAEQWYLKPRTNFQVAIRNASTPTSQNTTATNIVSTASNIVRLPKLELPNFAGDPTEWVSFHDAFVAAIGHNTNLADGQKLHYLQNCLKGEAARVVSNFKADDANYEQAWNLLKARYKVLRIIVQKHLYAIDAIAKTHYDSDSAIKQTLDGVVQHSRALEVLGRPVAFWDDWLVHVVVSKLCIETRKQWELSLMGNNPPTFDELRTFLENRCRSLAMVASIEEPQRLPKNIRKETKSFYAAKQSAPTSKRSSSSFTPKCLHCNGNHKIYECSSFKSLAPAVKRQLIQQKEACWNCLSTGHRVFKCRSKGSCRECQKRHHSLLHLAVTAKGKENALNERTVIASHEPNPINIEDAPDIQKHAWVPTSSNSKIFPQSLKPTSASTAAAFTGTVNTFNEGIDKLSCLSANEIPLTFDDTYQDWSSHNAECTKTVLLATAQVRVQDGAGCWQTARMLFDSGSCATFVTEACVQRLRLSRKSSSLVVTGIGSSQGGRTRGECALTLSSLYTNNQFTINALILSKICNELPIVMSQVYNWQHIKGLQLADPSSSVSGHIDILVGMDEIPNLLLAEIRKGSSNQPVAQNSIFGWVIYGCIPNLNESHTNVQNLHCDVELAKTVAKLWELEESDEKKHSTIEEIYCDDLFDATHRRTTNGQFIVKLPFRNSIRLGETRSIAVRRFLSLEKRLNANVKLRLEYNAFMNELLDMGHMERVQDVPEKCFYMSHHPVVKDSSITTRLRVVFNASMKSSSGQSLNDALMVGPQLQSDLFSILLRFRTHRYAMIADITKMYRMVFVSPEHTDYQRIVWREDPLKPLEDFRMLRVTYGTAPASHLAVKALQQTAKDHSDSYPQTSRIILNDFYMDDLSTGTHDEKALVQLQEEITNVLLTGGFELRKWATNSVKLKNKLSITKDVHFLAENNEVRTLGIIWNTSEDSISFQVNMPEPPKLLTKRAFLSDAGLLFDPLGFIAPCTVRSKIWFQQIWKVDVCWDEAVPADIANQWLCHRRDLASLAQIKVKRWLSFEHQNRNITLHVFCDASERAYAAVIYARTVLENVVQVTLIAARTRVAPLKVITLPRLELCAAHLASKLTEKVISSFANREYQVYAWSDSTITLAWLQDHPSRWSTFVANRVADIQRILPSDRWGHVRSECNPADCASRGICPTELLRLQLWWTGPPWLRDDPETWRQQSNFNTSLEVRSKKVTSIITQRKEEWELIQKYSSYSKLKRIAAYVIRFVHNLKNKSDRRTGSLLCNEIREAEIVLFKYTQNIAFSNEFSSCRNSKPVPLRSPLARVQPFLDSNEVLRVGGRIKHSDLRYDARNPIILPKRSALAKLIVSEIHKLTLHAGPRIMQTVLQQRFWLPGARRLIRKILHSCVNCIKQRRQPLKQVMADLPVGRTLYVRPFLRSAVDYAGPFNYKYAAGRGSKSIKGYIAIFICMGTGAMHLEFVGDLSAITFLNAYKRFISRRGYCQHMHSDNGTNFIGAERELRSMIFKCLDEPKMRDFFADSHVSWHFNPPSAPHMGGYWEAGVKRVKHHLRRAVGNVLLTFEEFCTLLCEIEACVNSRPLCAQSVAQDDFDVLTPGHFLVGEPLKVLPGDEILLFKGNLSQRWSLISAIRQHFWRRWRYEYLISLQQRSKWTRKQPELKKDDTVIVLEPVCPPSKWKIARVIECYPGADNMVRVVKLKTNDGECLRPIHKLCKLPINESVFSKNEM